MAVCVPPRRPRAHGAPRRWRASASPARFVVLLVRRTRWRGRCGRARRQRSAGCVLRGVLGAAAAITCYYVGIGRAGAGLATLLHSTYPVFTALFAVAAASASALTRRAAAPRSRSTPRGAAIVLRQPRRCSGAMADAAATVDDVVAHCSVGVLRRGRARRDGRARALDGTDSASRASTIVVSWRSRRGG